jgi:UDP-N-acetyl-3-dehydro-alpha-D-glucosamine 3-aminotranferase
MNSPIPMVDPAAEYRLLKAEIDAAVSRVLASGRYVLGPEGEALEREIAAYVGAAHAVGCNSGTDALHLPLVAIGVGPGDEVVVPAFTFFATAEAVSYTGATPVFADIDPASFNLSVASLEPKVTARTRAVIVVHLFGQCAAMDEISAFCASRGLVLIEDCAQALGAQYQDRRAGGWGEFGCFSFYPTKNLAAAGDAGMITTRNPDYDKTLRMLRHHGSRQTYLHERVGWNSRLDELQAAVLRARLPLLRARTEQRRALAAEYRRRLSGAPVSVPIEMDPGHVYHLFPVRTTGRAPLQAHLRSAGIETLVHYPVPVSRQAAFTPAHPADCPIANLAADEVLSLPLHPGLSLADVAAVADAVRSFAGRGGKELAS